MSGIDAMHIKFQIRQLIRSRLLWLSLPIAFLTLIAIVDVFGYHIR